MKQDTNFVVSIRVLRLNSNLFLMTVCSITSSIRTQCRPQNAFPLPNFIFRKVYLWVSYDLHNSQRLLSHTALTGLSLSWRCNMFSVGQDLKLKNDSYEFWAALMANKFFWLCFGQLLNKRRPIKLRDLTFPCLQESDIVS